MAHETQTQAQAEHGDGNGNGNEAVIVHGFLVMEDGMLPTDYDGLVPAPTTPDEIAAALYWIKLWKVNHAVQQVGQIRKGTNRPVTVMFPITEAANPRDARDAHYSGVPTEIAKHYKTIAQSLYFNQICNHNGEASNIDLARDPAGKTICAEVRETLNTRNVICVLPFVDKERNTIAKNMEYALSVLGEGRVLAVHSGKERDLEDIARETGGMVVNQDDILRCIDWKKMAQLGIIPPYFHLEEDGVPAKGPAHRNFTKGLTMMAGALALEASGFLEDHDVAWHDTDVENPEVYKALEYLYLADTFAQGQEINARRIARNGEGRNNEMWQAKANQIGTEALTMMKNKLLHPNKPNPYDLSDDDFYSGIQSMMELSIMLGNNTWPLTGERAGKVRDQRFTTGMGIESAFDVQDAGVDVRRKTNTVAQVGNPSQKIENADVDLKREWMLMNYCADFQGILVEHSLRTGKMLGEWSMGDIRDFNNLYSDMLQTYAVQQQTPNAAPYTGLAQPEFVLPSIAQIRSFEANTGVQLVDWEGIRKVVEKQNPDKQFVRAVAKAA